MSRHDISCGFHWIDSSAEFAGTAEQAQARRAPLVFKRKHPDIVRLFPDYQKVEEEYFARTRVTHLVMAMALPGVDPKKVSASMRLFAKEVLPRLPAATATPSTAHQAAE